MIPPIRLLLVDDHAVVREGLRALLEQQPDLTVVGEAEDAQAAIREAERLRPDVVLIDLKMPGLSVEDAVRLLGDRLPDTRILIFTSYIDAAQLRALLDAGVDGYLLKDALREDLVRAVKVVSQGQSWLHPTAQKLMLDLLRRPASPLEQLTLREQSVLDLLARGMSNKLIARELHLTPGTVKGYVSRVIAKLGVADRTQAALMAQNERLAHKP